MLKFSQLFIRWLGVRRNNYVRCSKVSGTWMRRPTGRPFARFVTSISQFFLYEICIKWVDIARQSRHAVRPALSAFLYKYFDISFICSAEFHKRNCVDPFVRCVLIWFIPSRQNVRHPVLSGRGAAAFVNLLAHLLVFSLVGANKKLRMCLVSILFLKAVVHLILYLGYSATSWAINSFVDVLIYWTFLCRIIGDHVMIQCCW